MREVLLAGPRDLRLHALVPEGWRERIRGLLRLQGLEPDQAMLLERTRSVHTFGMRYEIAAVLLDPDLLVRGIIRLRPGRVLLPRRAVRHVLECSPGVDLRRGDSLRMLPVGRYTSRRCPRRRRAPIV